MPVSELDKSNVTLYCDLEQGNPPTLHAVRWYKQKYKKETIQICEEENYLRITCPVLLKRSSQNFVLLECSLEQCPPPK